MSEQEQTAAALERYLTEQTQSLGRSGFTALEQAKDLVDLEVAYSPVLMPKSIRPVRAVSLANGNYAIYDVGYPLANMGSHRWNVTPDELKEHRARFLLQRDIFFQDLVMRRRVPEWFTPFRTYEGLTISSPPASLIEKEIVPLYFPGGTVVPSPGHPLSEKVAKIYVYIDGTVEPVSFL